MKKVLMIVYSFSPVKYPGAERAIGFIRQLRNYGWEPLVLTRESGSDAPEEAAAQMPEGIDIVRTSFPEPDRSSNILGAAANIAASLLIPDKERLWELFSSRQAARMAKYAGVDLVYTVSPPSSVHLIGLHLKRKYPALPWVADLCAPQVTSRTNTDRPASSPHFYTTMKGRYEKMLLERIAEGADFIVTGDHAILESIKKFHREPDSGNAACLVSDGQALELSELFEKACRAIAARKLAGE